MSLTDPALLTAAQLAAAPAAERAALVEAWLVASIAALRPGGGPVDPEAHLADLGIDSLQVVELKFGLDQLLGQDVDIERIVGNPTVRGLAADSVRDAGL